MIQSKKDFCEPEINMFCLAINDVITTSSRDDWETDEMPQ